MCTARPPGASARRRSLTMCGSWMLARLWIRDWLRLASSCRSDSFCCSITLFSSSMVLRLDSMVVICNAQTVRHVTGAGPSGRPRRPTRGRSLSARIQRFLAKDWMLKGSLCVLWVLTLSTWQVDANSWSLWKGIGALRRARFPGSVSFHSVF